MLGTPSHGTAGSRPDADLNSRTYEHACGGGDTGFSRQCLAGGLWHRIFLSEFRSGNKIITILYQILYPPVTAEVSCEKAPGFSINNLYFERHILLRNVFSTVLLYTQLYSYK